MILIVGLGNPGREYEKNRHNVGWMAVDAIHRRHGFAPWKRRFSADIAEGTLGSAKAMLMKPLTFMNESGRSVGEAARFHKIGLPDIVVLHDELDLPPGKVRIKTGGSGAGHNGIRSVSAHVGPEYRRLRIGIGHPGHRDRVHGYVLHDFAKSDAAWLDPLLDAIGDEAPLLAAGKDAEFANRLHIALGPADAKKPKPPKAQQPGPESVSAPSETRQERTDSPAAPSEPHARGPFAGLRRLFGGGNDS